MMSRVTFLVITGLILLLVVLVIMIIHQPVPGNMHTRTIQLPDPNYDGDISLEKAVRTRRSVREYSNKSLALTEVSQLLWAAQGITSASGFRSAPSAGALYPMEVYLVAGNVENLPAGIYKYQPKRHELIEILAGDKRSELASVALEQQCIIDGAISIVVAGVYERTMIKYGERGKRYVLMEVGNISQNICLQAVTMNLGTVVVGAFQDSGVQRMLQMPSEEQPFCIMPVGKRK